jgi:predicted RecA/RadA family phage recombinase
MKNRSKSMQNYVHKGETLTVAAPYAVKSGGGVKVGNLFGVAVYDAAQSASLEIVSIGVFDLAKDNSTFASGDAVYWDDTNKVATSTSGNLVIGTAELAQASGTAAPGGAQADPTVRVRLNGFLPGATGVSTGVRVAHALYDFTVDGGASCTPANSDTIPANAAVFGGVINSTVALAAAGAATFAVGTTAGSAGNSILTATGKATLGLDAVIAPSCVATPFKMSAAGKISVAIATGPLTAGQVEIWVLYFLATNA